jgi:tRNA(Ile)-lysidine synthase
MKFDYLKQKFENNGINMGFLQENTRILIGFSGGSDSLSLVLLLIELQIKYNLFIMCAHVNYNLRGEESKKDENFVKEFCFKNNITLCILNANINKNEGVQQKARKIRMSYFKKLKKNYKINYIALGHQKDDQAETVLHRFIRGSGFRGLAGIHPISNDIIHPLLPFHKQELIDFVKQQGLTSQIDKSNYENDYTRNKIRNELIPTLKKDYQSNIEEKLVEYSKLFYSADDYFTKIAKKELKKSTIEKDYNKVILDINYLKKLSEIEQFYIIKAVWTSFTHSELDFYSVHYKEVQNILLSNSGMKEISLPDNIKAIKDYDKIIFICDNIKEIFSREKSKEIPNVRAVLTFNDTRYYMKKMKHLPVDDITKVNNEAIIDLDKIKFPITLRYRGNGDKFMPLGMNNFKKVKDFFIDKKISKFERDNIVLFCDTEKIFWISGYRIDQRVAVENSTKNFLLLKQEHLSETRKIKLK